MNRIELDPAATHDNAHCQEDWGTIMDRMQPIVIDPVVSRYIEAARKNRHETVNEILRRLLKLDEIPRPAPGEVVVMSPEPRRSASRRR